MCHIKALSITERSLTRQTIYSSDLKELREKEKAIQKQLDEGIDYAAGAITVIALLEQYISLKQGVRYNTKVGYNFVLNLIKKEDFGYRQIKDIKVSDAQQWIMKLHNDGKGYSTITSVRGVVKPAFQMAYNEDIFQIGRRCTQRFAEADCYDRGAAENLDELYP